MNHCHQPLRLLRVATLLSCATGLVAQATLGAWTLALENGSVAHGNVVACAPLAGGVQNGPCVTLKAIATLGGPAPLAGSACARFLTATATLTVGPTARSVAFNYTFVGRLADQAPGELCYATADVALDGNQILAYNPLPVGQLTPCVPFACVPLAVNQPGAITICVAPGAHTVVARIALVTTDTMLGAGQTTSADFFTGSNGLSVCVADQGPCTVASARSYGVGCHGIVLGASAPPLLGTAIDLVTNGVPAGAQLGAQILSFLQFDPGIELSSLGMPGCYQLANADTVYVLVPAAGSMRQRLVLPPSPALVGAHVFTQSVAFAPGVNQFGAVSSNGLDLGLDSF